MMDSTRDFRFAQEDIQTALVNTTRAATRISVEDITFHRASNATVSRSLGQQNSRLLSLADRLLRTSVAGYRTNLSTIDGLDNNWPAITDAIDNLLERCDTYLDEFKGLFRQPGSRTQVDV